jgi:hypothetical protein
VTAACDAQEKLTRPAPPVPDQQAAHAIVSALPMMPATPKAVTLGGASARMLDA